MSFDLFVQCYGETGQSGIPVSAVRSLFPIVREEPEFRCWVLEYDSQNQSDIYVGLLKGDKEKLGHFTVSRPSGDVRFWEALFSILRMGSVMICWPESQLVLAAGASADGLPENMLKGLGGPVFVRSGLEILKLVQET